MYFINVGHSIAMVVHQEGITGESGKSFFCTLRLAGTNTLCRVLDNKY